MISAPECGVKKLLLTVLKLVWYWYWYWYWYLCSTETKMVSSIRHWHM